MHRARDVQRRAAASTVDRLVAPQLSGRDVHVAVLSNASKTFPIWCMRNASEPGGLVVWDYHVVAIERRAGRNPTW